MLEALAAAVAGTEFARWAAGDRLAYPVANAVHLVGLVLLVGSAWMMDARLLGAFRGLWPGPLVRALGPVALAGLLVLVASGTILFAADAVALAVNETFRWKLVLIGLALGNALLFRLGWRGGDSVPPLLRLSAAASALLWLLVLWQGRMIAYS